MLIAHTREGLGDVVSKSPWARQGKTASEEDACRQVKGRLDLAVTDLGQTQLKNIAEPIRVYSLASPRRQNLHPQRRRPIRQSRWHSACVLPVHTTHSGRRKGGLEMGIFSWIVLGLVTGWIASKIVNKTGSGMMMDMASPSTVRTSFPSNANHFQS
jgi:hypothetical protein